MINRSAKTTVRKAIKSKDDAGTAPAAPRTKRARKQPATGSSGSAQAAQPNASAAAQKVPGRTTKQVQLAALLIRDEGATLDQMIAATGWLPHTTRAALTGLRKKGYVIDSDKVDGHRTYRAVAPK